VVFVNSITIHANDNLIEAYENAERDAMKPVYDFLKKGGDANFRNTDGPTLLAVATNWNHRDIVKELLKKGADPNICLKDNWCPLHIAASRDTEILRMLVEAGANVNVSTSEYNITPLGRVAGNTRRTFEGLTERGGYHGPFPNSIESTRILINAGAKVNCVDKWGEGNHRYEQL
jgi:ankyrin repeat protein